jgi:allophanate hydrolase subunit 2
MSLLVIDPGLHSLLVDLGRPRSRALGVPLGGVADRGALALGNALVGNAPDVLAIECTLAGPTLRAEHRTACVLFGAAFPLTVNERCLSAATTFTLDRGEVLRIGGTRSGARGYLCVAGGFDAPSVLDSRSALEPLKRRDILACRASWCERRGLPFDSLVLPSEDSGSRLTRIVRVLDGPQRDWFPDDRFFTQDYEVTAASDRMGLRLSGEPLTRKPGELVSEAVAPGAVQVTNDGLPIVL